MVLLCAFGIVVVCGVPLYAAGGDPAAPAPFAPQHIAPFLESVAVTGVAVDRAAAAASSAQARLVGARERLEDTLTRQRTLQNDRRRLVRAIAIDAAVRRAADAKVDTLRIQLRHLALQAYVSSDDRASWSVSATLDTGAFIDARTSVTLRQAATSRSHADYLSQRARSRRASERLARNGDSLVGVERALTGIVGEVDDAEAAIQHARVAVLQTSDRLRDARAIALVEGTDMPLVALDAYVHGAAIANWVSPGCHLQWPLLAGIGKIESGQGTSGGAALLRDGTLSRPILGIALDGSRGTEVIRAADGGYARAEGPMQFLASTWSAVAVDGDGDHQADIQNLYDAAATAGVYLCRHGVDLATSDGLRNAILAYNFSGAYVAAVTRSMRAYAELLREVPTA